MVRVNVVMPPDQTPLRARRITRACDRCNRYNTKCSKGPDSTCLPCFEFGEKCTYDRPVKSRGPRGRRSSNHPVEDQLPTNDQHPQQLPTLAWSVPTPEVIEKLVDGYLTIVYPIFPLFHWPSFKTDVQQLRYKSDPAFYIVTMMVCAIVSDRLRHGAQLASPFSPSDHPSSETFHQLAMDAFPSNLSEAVGFDYKRAKALMAILNVQYGQITNVHTHLGDYGTLSFNDNWYDEGKWPVDLTPIQLEEWRRLFWSTYTLEIFAAITWGGIVRHRQSQCNVQYPSEVRSDGDITEVGCFLPDDPQSASFLHGWNATTDLYRILEYLVDHIRSRRFHSSVHRRNRIAEILTPSDTPTPVIHALIEELYNNLPQTFKHAIPMSGIVDVDRFGFQAANICITYQTVKMVLAGLEESNVETLCAIAGSLLEALATIPTAYIAAISAPMLYHLASVGHLLANVIQNRLTQWAFLQVRNVILAMANLIASLESVLMISPGISVKLKTHVSTIDGRLDGLAQEATMSQVYHNPVARDTLEWDFMSPDQQAQLQSDLTLDWPFDLDMSNVFDFLET